MNKIEFRVWDVKRQKFHYGCSNLMIGTDGTIFWQFGYNEPSPVDKEKFLPQLYTGLKDKNGIKIFDGDIKDLTGDRKYLVVITYCQKRCAFVAVSVEKYKPEEDYELDDTSDHLYGGESSEVIGNIYQNPELL